MPQPKTYAERAREVVDRWLADPITDVEITDEGFTLRDVLTCHDDGDLARKSLERRVADALRTSWLRGRDAPRD